MPLHSCQNCLHHVSSGSVRCLVENAPAVQDPGAGNRCDHFEFAANVAPPEEFAEQNTAPNPTSGPVTDPASARKRWAELFGGE